MNTWAHACPFNERNDPVTGIDNGQIEKQMLNDRFSTLEPKVPIRSLISKPFDCGIHITDDNERVRFNGDTH